MTDSKLKVPLTAFEKAAQALLEANDLVDKVMRDKRVVDNLERYDIKRRFQLVADLARILRLEMTDILRVAAQAQAEGGEI